MPWRTEKEPSIKGKQPKVKTKAPHDPTYGKEPDMLDQPGLLVEPDVRQKIAKYFKQMRLREILYKMVLEQE